MLPRHVDDDDLSVGDMYDMRWSDEFSGGLCVSMSVCEPSWYDSCWWTLCADDPSPLPPGRNEPRCDWLRSNDTLCCRRIGGAGCCCGWC